MLSYCQTIGSPRGFFRLRRCPWIYAKDAFRRKRVKRHLARGPELEKELRARPEEADRSGSPPFSAKLLLAQRVNIGAVIGRRVCLEN